jgi:NAD(P)-dependent dehydrogenase (short-subunit alcohol dehydrogenase family)
MMASTAPAPAARSAPTGWADLSGRTVLVTGASSGLGRGCALALAACGADLILAARTERSLAEVSAEIELTSSTHVQTMVLNVTDTQVVRQRIAAIPRLDGLVNNAGQNFPQWLQDVDETRFDAIFALNVKAAFFVAQACVAKLREGGRGGAIVNVSSQMGHVGAAKRTVYCASKHALEGMTKAMAVELAREGIRVNSVCPTFIATPMTAPMFEEPEFRAEVTSKIPMGRVGTVEEVASAVAFLLSPAASLITGSSLLIDGGWTAQ